MNFSFLKLNKQRGVYLMVYFYGFTKTRYHTRLTTTTYRKGYNENTHLRNTLCPPY